MEQIGNDLNKKILDSLGLSDKRITKCNISLRLDSCPLIQIEYIPTEQTIESLRILFKEYELKEYGS